MTIPFLGLFKKAKARLFQPGPSSAPTAIRPVAVEKKTGERLSKTVLPNTTRTLTQPDPFKVAAGGSATKSRGISASSALASEATGERAISLQLGEILERLPRAYMKGAEDLDTKRSIVLKASEFEKGMATEQPTVALTSIFEQAPEIFSRSVLPDDATQVFLPYEKVLEQISNVQVRADQTQENDVPQLETPFLQVTLEDTERFGTTMAPLQASAKPPVKVEPATARTLATAEPEGVVKEKIGAGAAGRTTIPPPSPNQPFNSPMVQPTPRPTRIPFHLPPNGTGAPASERVPASSGPPVPTPPPTTPPPASPPARIPFKIPAPAADVRPKLTLVPGVDPNDEKAPAKESREPKKDEVKVALALQVVMQNVPAFQLRGNASEIPADVRVELPCSLIEPQLATGRIAIEPKIFQAAIPEAYREMFMADPTETPVLLPLQEVLKNLPTSALQMRADQHKEEAIDHFETPFSQHAEQDAQRFQGTGPKPVETEAKKPEETPAAPESAESAAKEKVEATATPAVEPTPAEQKSEAVVEAAPAPKPEEKSEAKEFVSRVTGLPGVAACSITFADGLSLAGNFPTDVKADGLCAMAPSLLERIGKHMLETNLGALDAVTLHCSNSPVTFFREGNVCLAVLHSDRQLEAETQRKLSEMVKELSHVYAQPEPVHVDH